MLTVQQLSTVVRGRKVLDRVSFAAGTGEKLALIGRRGSGIDQLMKIICGYMRPKSGKVQIGPFDLGRQNSQARQLIGFMPAQAPLYPELKVGAYLQMCASLRGLADPSAAAQELAEPCGLSKIWQQPIKKLSRGLQQQINLAQAVLHDPVLLVVDDPFVALDPAERHTLLGILQKYSTYKTMVFTSHNLDLLPQLCQRLLVLQKGQISFDGKLTQLTEYRGIEAAFLHYTASQEAP